MDFMPSVMEPTDEVSSLNGMLPEEQDLATFLRGIDESLTNPTSFENDSLSILSNFDHEGYNESGDQPLQLAANPHETLQQQQQQQASEVVLIDGSGERLDPTDPETNFTVQEEVAEINSMTASEIDKVKSDLHGITKNMSNLAIRDMSFNLQKMNDELSKLPPEQTAVYSRALKECPGLVSDKRKMAFLQREDNNPALAAARFASYWEYRLELFGPKRCFLPMTLSGAMRDETKNIVEFPIIQLLPVKDAAGRAILFIHPSLRDFTKYSIQQELMAAWYLIEVAMDDLEVQRRGIVIIFNLKDVEPKHFSRKFASLHAKFFDRAFPIQIRAMHGCYPNFFVNFFIVPASKLLLGRKNRQRAQLHYGSTAEVLKTLEAFCLPKDRLPTDVGGDIVLDMAKWVTERRALEESRPDPRLISDEQDPEGPAFKRLRSEHTMPIVERTVSANVHDDVPVNAPPRRQGRPSDPRMDRAVEARLANPVLSLQDALEEGGFTFDSRDAVGRLVDADNITIKQHKNQLNRRLRRIKEQQKQQSAKSTR